MTDQRIEKLAAKIQKHMTIDESGFITGDKKLVSKTLPKDISEDDLKAVQAHLRDVTVASGYAVGNMGVEAMKANSDIQEVQASLDYGLDKFSHNLKGRHETKRGEEKVVTWGSIRSAHRMEDTDTRTSMRAMRESIANMAKEELDE